MLSKKKAVFIFLFLFMLICSFIYYMYAFVYFPEKKYVIDSFLSSLEGQSYTAYYENNIEKPLSKSVTTGSAFISDSGITHFVGVNSTRNINDISTVEKNIEWYADESKNSLYVRNKDRWISYEGLDRAVARDFWLSEINSLSYEGRYKTPSGKKAHLLSAVYENAELSKIVSRLHLFPQGRANLSDAIGQLYVYLDTFTKEPVEVIFVIKTPSMPFSVYYPSETHEIVSYEMSVIFDETSYTEKDIPSDVYNSEKYQIESFLGDIEGFGTKPDVTIKKYNIEAGFVSFGTYTKISSNKNSIDISSLSDSRGSMKMTIEKGKDVYMDIKKDRDSSLEYYNKKKYGGIHVSDVVQSSSGDNSVYWYMQTYTTNEYTHTDYIMCLDAGDGICVRLVYSMDSGLGVKSELSKKDIMDIISHMWVKN